jgi:hypothetical protein
MPSPLLIALLVLIAAACHVRVWTMRSMYGLIAKAFTKFGRQTYRIGNHAQSTTHPQAVLLMACMTVCLLIWTSCVFFVQSVVNYQQLSKNQSSDIEQFGGSNYHFFCHSLPGANASLSDFLPLLSQVPCHGRLWIYHPPLTFVFLCCSFCYVEGLSMDGLYSSHAY